MKDSKISRPLFASAYVWHFAFLSTNWSILRLNFDSDNNLIDTQRVKKGSSAQAPQID